MTEKQFIVTNISANGMKGLFKLGNDTLSVYDVVRLINDLLDENEQLKKENHGIQDKVIRLLDYVEVKQCVTRTEIKKWWND